MKLNNILNYKKYFKKILNYILIPVYGAIGAAVATIVAQFVSGFIVPIFFRIDKKYPMIVFKSLLHGVKI